MNDKVHEVKLAHIRMEEIIDVVHQADENNKDELADIMAKLVDDTVRLVSGITGKELTPVAMLAVAYLLLSCGASSAFEFLLRQGPRTAQSKEAAFVSIRNILNEIVCALAQETSEEYEKEKSGGLN